MSQVRRYSYPRFVGGPHAKKKVPAIISTYRHPPPIDMIAPSRRLAMSYGGDPPPIDMTFSTTTYSKHRGGFGPDRMVEFWADSRLTGEDAFDQLVTDMFSRCGVRRED